MQILVFVSTGGWKTIKGTDFMKLYFTLIELLVLVTIISILGSLLLPVMGGAKYQSKLTQCIGNEHQLGVAISRYSSDFNEFLPRLSVNVEGGCRPAIKYNGVDDRPLLQSYMSLNDVYMYHNVADTLQSDADMFQNAT